MMPHGSQESHELFLFLILNALTTINSIVLLVLKKIEMGVFDIIT